MFLRKDGMNVVQRDDLTGSAEQRRDGVAANKTTATGYKDSVNAHFLTGLESAPARHRTRKVSTIAARVPASRPSRSAASWRICCPSLHSRSPPTRDQKSVV